MWVCDFHYIVVEQLQVAVRVNNGLVTTSAPGCVSETNRYFWYVLCRSYFMMCKTDAKYTMFVVTIMT